MTSQTIHQHLFEELDRREGDGLEVTLLWSRSDNTLSVFVSDSRTGDAFEIPVRADEALDAFRHPYAYAAFRGWLGHDEHGQAQSIAA